MKVDPEGGMFSCEAESSTSSSSKSDLLQFAKGWGWGKGEKTTSFNTECSKGSMDSNPLNVRCSVQFSCSVVSNSL